ncbi:hypothetical protein BM221_003189 [Beauveria bassiana]|uniref:Uncharacterized protein n=1 Tax=Beauveria bassiana TaxID=176275 RepID=A0A2N6NTY6_BEABA|nr:hypothetical protein BM221_003189 [Beauveria bassiana]
MYESTDQKGRTMDISHQRVVGGASLTVAAALVAVDVLRDLNVFPGGAGAVGIDHARVGAGTVRVDLVKGHGQLAAGGDLGESASSLGHDLAHAAFKIVGALADSLAQGISRGTAEAGGVLLEGIASGSVTGSRGHDSEGHALATGVTNSAGDGGVARDEPGSHEHGSSEDRLDGSHFSGEKV